MSYPTKKIEEVTERLELKKAPIGSWPYVEIGDIDLENKSIVFKDKKSIKGAVIVPEDSVLVSRVRPTRGAITLIDKNYVASSAFTILKAKRSETTSKFLFYWLNSSRKFLVYLQSKQKGSNYPSVREKDILNFEIPALSLEAQKQITDRLDKIAEAQKLNDELIQKSDELFQSLLHRELKSGKNWKAQKLENLLELCDAGVWGKATKGGGMMVLRSTNFKSGGVLDFSNVPELKIDEKKRAKVKLMDGDVLLEKSGGGPDQPVGRVVYFIAPDQRDYTFANFIQRLRASSDVVNNNFLFYHLLRLHNVGYTKKLQSQTTGIRNLKLSLYMKTEIPFPPLAIQKQIVSKLSAVQDYKKQLLAQKSKLKELFDSVLSKSMTN